MGAPLVAQPVDLLNDKTKLLALRELLRLDGSIYLPADGLGDTASPVAWCIELEAALGPGAEVTFFSRGVLSGPARFYGRERLRIELRRRG